MISCNFLCSFVFFCHTPACRRELACARLAATLAPKAAGCLGIGLRHLGSWVKLQKEIAAEEMKAAAAAAAAAQETKAAETKRLEQFASTLRFALEHDA